MTIPAAEGRFYLHAASNARLNEQNEARVHHGRVVLNVLVDHRAELRTGHASLGHT